MSLSKRFSLMVRTALLAAFLAFFATSALAVDKVTLKDGRTLEGTITREVDGIIWLKYEQSGIPQETMFRPDEITKIERDAAAATPSEAPVKADTSDPKTATPSKPGVPKGVVLTLGDEENGHEVGNQITARQLELAIPELEKLLGTDGSGIVVLRIHSGGGSANEVPKLQNVIQNEYKKRWRTVAWIDAAISAAAMTSHVMEEIYFTSQGNYGACTAWSGDLVSAEGPQLIKYLYMMEKVSAEGNHNPLIMRAMQIQQPLSCTIDSNGEVHWYADATTGDILVNRPGEILTFNAVTAAKVKFSRGTADTLAELTKAMGYQEVDWLGAPPKRTAWPITKVEQEQMDFRKRVHDDEERTKQYQRTYGMELQAAQGTPKPDRAKFVGRAREALEKMKAMMRNNPNFSYTVIGRPPEMINDWVEAQEKLLRELMR